MKLRVNKKEAGKKPHNTIVAKNGEILFSSETYASNSNAKRAARRFVARLMSGGLQIEPGVRIAKKAKK